MLLAILLTVGVNQYAVKLRQMDRAEYLAGQGRRYDRQHAHPDSIIALAFASAVLVGGAVTAYELFAFGISKLLNKAAPDVASTDSRASPGNNGAP